jgi:hypothetical protein
VNVVFRYLEAFATRWRRHGDSISAAPAEG